MSVYGIETMTPFTIKKTSQMREASVAVHGAEAGGAPTDSRMWCDGRADVIMVDCAIL